LFYKQGGCSVDVLLVCLRAEKSLFSAMSSKWNWSDRTGRYACIADSSFLVNREAYCEANNRDLHGPTSPDLPVDVGSPVSRAVKAETSD
jgi:hypothetical protein